MHELLMLKKLLGITDDQKDFVLGFIIESAADMIKNYCNTKMVPDGLRNTHISICVDMYRSQNLGSEQDALVVKSITEGTVSTSFETKGRKMSGDDTNTYLTPYLSQLRRYRRLSWT